MPKRRSKDQKRVKKASTSTHVPGTSFVAEAEHGSRIHKVVTKNGSRWDRDIEKIRRFGNSAAEQGTLVHHSRLENMVNKVLEDIARCIGGSHVLGREVTLPPHYLKALEFRSHARIGLKKWDGAIEDANRCLEAIGGNVPREKGRTFRQSECEMLSDRGEAKMRLGELRGSVLALLPFVSPRTKARPNQKC